MADQPEDQKNKVQPDIPLSAAFLAPLNSIFEAQIHAARSFLNFLLKMGFRHVVSDAEFEQMKKDAGDLQKEIEKEKNESTPNEKLIASKQRALNQVKRQIEIEEKRRADHGEMKKLFDERKKLAQQGEKLSPDKVSKLKDLNASSGDLFQQSFDYIDDNGNKMTVAVPNLALLPVKPLSIQEADLSFEFHVNEIESWQTKDNGDRKRPWFLIDEPKSLRGSFVRKNAQERDSVISINMKIEASEMPSGLEKLMVHLTNSIERIDIEDN